MSWSSASYYLDGRLEIIRSTAGQPCGDFRPVYPDCNGWPLNLALASACSAEANLEHIIDFYIDAVARAPKSCSGTYGPHASSGEPDRSHLR